MNTSKITPKTIAEELSAALKDYTKKVMKERISGTKLRVDFSWDDEEFYLDFYPNQDIEYQLTFSADIDSTFYGEEDTIITFTNINLKSAEVDSYSLGHFEIAKEDSESLVEAVKELIHNGNFYGIEPDDYTIFAIDADGAKSDLEDRYRSNEPFTMSSLGFSTSDFL